MIAFGGQGSISIRDLQLIEVTYFSNNNPINIELSLALALIPKNISLPVFLSCLFTFVRFAIETNF